MIRLVIAFLLLATPVWAADLTLKHVMLSSGGVGYFEYAADVDGDATLGLDVPLGQVDDILKSLVVFDSGGSVAGVELPGRDNTVQAFGDAPFGPEALKSPTAYLNALAGTEVTVQGPRPMTGRIVSAEPETQTTDKVSTQRTRVTLLSADGLRQFVLEDADTVQVTDPTLRARIEQALESLRRDASQTTRHLTIRLKGQGKRSVGSWLRGRSAAVEGDVPPDACPCARFHGSPARLGHVGKSIRRRLERRGIDIAVRQSGDLPAGAVSQLFRAAAGGSGGDSGTRAARYRYPGARRGAERDGASLRRHQWLLRSAACSKTKRGRHPPAQPRWRPRLTLRKPSKQPRKRSSRWLSRSICRPAIPPTFRSSIATFRPPGSICCRINSPIHWLRYDCGTMIRAACLPEC